MTMGRNTTLYLRVENSHDISGRRGVPVKWFTGDGGYNNNNNNTAVVMVQEVGKEQKEHRGE